MPNVDLHGRRVEPAAQRRLILEALIEVAAEHGYLDTTVEAVLDRAGVQRDDFDRHFQGKYDCVLSAWQEINEECLAAILKAYESAADWPDRLRAVAETVISSLCDDPARAAFGVEVLAAGDAARARRDLTIRVVTSLVDAGRQEMEDPEAVPGTTAEALTGSAYGQIYASVAGGALEELPALVPQLMSTLAMPYLGLEAALEELSRGQGEEGLSSPAAEVAAGDDGAPQGLLGLQQPRDRLIAGFAEAVAEHGYGATTIAMIARAGDVPRRTFYEHFPSMDECFVAAYEAIIDALEIRVAQAFECAPDWPHGVKRAIEAMLRLFSAEPAQAHLVMVEATLVGPRVIERYDAVIQCFLPYFEDGRNGADPAPAREHAAEHRR